MSEVGIGVIGTGFARRVQIPAFLECESARVVSVASGSRANAQAAAEEFGIHHFSEDWRETAAHPDVDLVCITTPPVLHREMVLFAVEHGKHVLCEKPMAMSVAEAEQMAAAFEGEPLLALIDHELRFQPGRQTARRMLADGAIGKVRHAKAIFQAPHRGDPGIAWNWWSDEAAGGGALGAIGSHIIDSFNWFLGSGIASVVCQLQTHVKQRLDAHGTMRQVTTDDEANLLLRFAGGEIADDATGLVSVSMVERPSYRNAIEFYGSEGSIRVEHRGDVYLANGDGDGWNEVPVDMTEPIPGMPDTGFTRGFRAFAPQLIDALRRGESTVTEAATFEDGVEVQRVLDAARLSSMERRSVKILR